MKAGDLGENPERQAARLLALDFPKRSNKCVSVATFWQHFQQSKRGE
jgi:hypothetical protein